MFQVPGLCEISGSSDGPNFLGKTYYIDCVDAEGKMHLMLVWIKETEYFIVSLVLYLRIAKISHCVGTSYQILAGGGKFLLLCVLD